MQSYTSLDLAATLHTIVQRTVASQCRSLDYYWPADARFRNDIVENNLTLHFAHAFLVGGYAVLAEVDHPLAQGLDLLAISPDRAHLFAIEVKRHIGGGMRSSAPDIERLQSFRLNRALPAGILGDEPLRVLSECKSGMGTVAGLKWHRTGEAPSLDADRTALSIKELGGEVHVVPVRRYPAGAYWLQFGFFALEP